MAYRRKRSKFAGADDIYLTGKSIAVRRVHTYTDRKGIQRLSDKTRYYPKTVKNIKQARSVFGNIRYGRR